MSDKNYIIKVKGEDSYLAYDETMGYYLTNDLVLFTKEEADKHFKDIEDDPGKPIMVHFEMKEFNI